MTAPSRFDGIRPGLRGESEFVVTDAMTTTHAGGGRGVMTTPDMIMQMEETAQEVTRPFLPEDHTTVGYEIFVRHRAAAPLGTSVRVSAELIEVDGRRLQFRVEARAGAVTVGEGTIRRTIIRLGTLDR
jgi:predicted thioesterase